jgi:hypothetical protein
MHLKLSYLSSIALLGLGLGLGVAAHATPITAIAAGTYNLTDATITGGNTVYSLTGTVTLNSFGLVSAADITLNDPALGNPVFDVVTVATFGGFNPVADIAFVQTAGNTAQLELQYLTTTDASGNIDLCTVAGNCNPFQDSNAQIFGASAFGFNPVDLNSGGSFDAAPSMLPPAVTPEPASLALLGTGIIGLATVLRKRQQMKLVGQKA